MKQNKENELQGHNKEDRRTSKAKKPKLACYMIFYFNQIKLINSQYLGSKRR